MDSQGYISSQISLDGKPIFRGDILRISSFERNSAGRVWGLGTESVVDPDALLFGLGSGILDQCGSGSRVMLSILKVRKKIYIYLREKQIFFNIFLNIKIKVAVEELESLNGEFMS